MTRTSPPWVRSLLTITAVAALLVLVVMLVTRRSPDTASDDEPMPGMTGMPDEPAMTMAGDGVRLTADQLRSFGVTVDSAAVRSLIDTIRAVGSVTWDETRIRHVTTRVDGYVEVLQADFTGQAVRRGAPLLELYAPAVVAAGEDLLAARALEEMPARPLPGIPALDTDLVASIRRRLKRWEVPDAWVSAVIATGEVPRRFPVAAPVSGLVIDKAVVLGQAVRAGDRLFTLVDPSVVWVEVEFREIDAARVAVGRHGTVALTGEPGASRHARVTFVHPEVDRATRTVRARLEVANPGGRLQAGRFAAVEIHDSLPATLTVPRSAVVTTGTGALVFRADPDGTLRPVAVEVTRVAGDLAAISGALAAGDRVVTSAQYLLEAESNLGALMKAMVGQMGGNAMPSMPGMEPMDGMDGADDMDGMTGMPGMADTGAPR